MGCFRLTAGGLALAMSLAGAQGRSAPEVPTRAAATAPSSPATLWLQPQPRTAAEQALRTALANPSAAAPRTLLAIAEQEPGSTAAGLARLAAARRWLDSGQAGDALAALVHPDLAHTALPDHTLWLRARAHEAAGERPAAREAYRAAAAAAAGRPLACTAWTRAADSAEADGQAAEAVSAFEQALSACQTQRARVLQRLAELRERVGDARGAAQAYDRLEREHPASPYARGTAARRAALAGLLPALSPAETQARMVERALALTEAGLYAEAEPALRAALTRAGKGDEAELLRVRLGRVLLARRRTREGLALLRSVPSGSSHAAEAALQLARQQPSGAARLAAYESVAQRFGGTPQGEEALLNLANHYQKDARDAEALPYYRRLVEEYPQGRYADRSAWRQGWGDWRAGRWDGAARIFEWAVRARPTTSFTPAFLYWAGRARTQLGEHDRARRLLAETVQRFKYTYHGQRAAEALAAGGAETSPVPALLARAVEDGDGLAEPARTRVAQLLLVDWLEEAADELRALEPAPAVQATQAWIEWRRGRLRPAINALKRAFPGHASEAADRLPPEALRILYPLEFRGEIESRAAATGLDAALVAALICQESTFDAGAVSSAGARGLMQVMPATGRSIARGLGQRYSRAALHDPQVSLAFGTEYLRQMLARFDGRAERALAAYNAGPHRVEAWTAGRPDMPAEEFVESIPFTETRFYVMTILAAREQYRRLYGLSAAPTRTVAGASSSPGRP